MPLLNPSAPPPTPASQLPDLPAGPSLESVRGPVDIPLFETWQLICIGILTAALFGILVSWLIRFLRSRAKCPASRPPENIARHAIEQANGDDPAYALALTQAVRSYLNTKLKRPILAQTSEETLSHLPPSFAVSAEDLRAFFQHCDTIKFGQAPLSKEQRIQLSDTALRLIETVHLSEKEAVKK